MMIPHHQGAIDMAQAKLRHGGNEQLRRIARKIIGRGSAHFCRLSAIDGTALVSTFSNKSEE
jgi:hypothetical protein